MQEDDYRLAYYRRANAFEVNVDREAPKPVAPSQRPNRAPKPEKVAAPAVDLGVEEVTPLAEPTPELPEGPPVSNIPDDEVLEGWLKDDLIDLAAEYGLAVDKNMTKAYIRAEIDTIR
ncbi:MAG TPA: hypothetical protein VMW52_08495 [Phycisphaerae bacterium]|nr:hypothetical protein [Phycisphaerae bacterium]